MKQKITESIDSSDFSKFRKPTKQKNHRKRRFKRFFKVLDGFRGPETPGAWRNYALRTLICEPIPGISISAGFFGWNFTGKWMVLGHFYPTQVECYTEYYVGYPKHTGKAHRHWNLAK